jgi:hypothetical protein
MDIYKYINNKFVFFIFLSFKVYILFNNLFISISIKMFNFISNN